MQSVHAEKIALPGKRGELVNIAALAEGRLPFSGK